MKYHIIRLQPQNLNILPYSPGVYMFKNQRNEILYIGKAKVLHNRVKSYFNKRENSRPYINKMVPLIKSIEYIETGSNINALILEASLIKKYKPKYNQELKDDKSYAWIYIDTESQFPTVKIVRRLNKQDFSKGKLFGPYPSGRTVKQLYQYIRTLYPFCTCNKKKSSSCLYVHLGLCPGPHQKLISEENYKKNINNIIKLLSGKKPEIIHELEDKMYDYANKQNFEKAIELRDKINNLKYISQKIDITPFTFEKQLFSDKYIHQELSYLKQLLKLENINRIECYDISHLQGTFIYGAMSVFQDNKIDKSEYRIFKIKRKSNNDFQNLYDVLNRRIKYLNNHKIDTSMNKTPDIILIDGDIHQLNKLKMIIPPSIRLVGISKGRYRRKQGYRLHDEFWVNLDGNIQRIALKYKYIFTILRDEAHRFAITHNKEARIKYSLRSQLEDIKGIGEKRLKCLIKRFKSLENIKRASIEDINKCIRNRIVTERLIQELNINKNHS